MSGKMKNWLIFSAYQMRYIQVWQGPEELLQRSKICLCIEFLFGTGKLDIFS
jgi:hypothetical protein